MMGFQLYCRWGPCAITTELDNFIHFKYLWATALGLTSLVFIQLYRLFTEVEISCKMWLNNPVMVIWPICPLYKSDHPHIIILTKLANSSWQGWIKCDKKCRYSLLMHCSFWKLVIFVKLFMYLNMYFLIVRILLYEIM